MKVLISGAGIGGLAAARALIADGHEVAVFEQAAELRHSGAAVTLWSNGTGVLNDLGVSLDNVGAPIDVLETRDHRGKALVSVDVAQAAARYGHPHLCLPRARLLDLLAKDLPPGTISFGHTAKAAKTQANGTVTLTFANGGTINGDLLVAADGRGSAIRDQVWGGDPGKLTGWATWQGISPVPVDITSSHRSVLFVGKPGTCGLMPAGEGLLQWWFDLRWTPGTPPPAKPLTMIRERFGAWAQPIPDVLKAVTDEETGFFPHYRHRVPRSWGSGRITVIGDAAHSMPPTRAQGANQSLEDAWALAAALRAATSTKTAKTTKTTTEDALRAFERQRSAKVSVVSRQAGSEDYNKYGAVLTRLVPSSFATRYYTKWLAQISSYLTQASGSMALWHEARGSRPRSSRAHPASTASGTRAARSFTSAEPRACGEGLPPTGVT
jgi:FAD-dependent urate hydroxylase